MKIAAITNDTMNYFKGFLPQPIPVSPTEHGQMLLLGSVDDGTACGALAIEYQPLHAYLHSVAVSEKFRRRGIGTAMLKQAALVFAEAGVKRIETVLCARETETNAAHSFLVHNGFTPGNRGMSFSVPLDSVAHQPFFDGCTPGEAFSPSVLPFSALPASMVRAFNDEMAEEVQFIGEIDAKRICTACSVASVTDGKIDGCILFEPQSDGSVILSLLYVQKAVRARSLLKSGMSALLSRYPGDTKIHVAAVTPASEKIARKLFAGCPCESLMSRTYTCSVFDIIMPLTNAELGSFTYNLSE